MTLSPFVRDLAERAAATFVQAFVAAIPMTQAVDAAVAQDVSTLQSIGLAAGTAGLAAALSVVKSSIARRFGVRESASLDPRVGA